MATASPKILSNNIITQLVCAFQRGTALVCELVPDYRTTSILMTTELFQGKSRNLSRWVRAALRVLSLLFVPPWKIVAIFRAIWNCRLTTMSDFGDKGTTNDRHILSNFAAAAAAAAAVLHCHRCPHPIIFSSELLFRVSVWPDDDSISDLSTSLVTKSPSGFLVVKLDTRRRRQWAEKRGRKKTFWFPFFSFFLFDLKEKTFFRGMWGTYFLFLFSVKYFQPFFRDETPPLFGPPPPSLWRSTHSPLPSAVSSWNVRAQELSRGQSSTRNGRVSPNISFYNPVLSFFFLSYFLHKSQNFDVCDLNIF